MAFNQFPVKGGIPSGNTANRPSNPVIGDTYYNGQLEILEIFNGTIWVASSAPPATPTIATPTDASTTDAYTATAGKLQVVFTPGSGGGTPSQYNLYATAGGFSTSNSSSTVTLTGLTPGTSYTLYGNAQNNFGTTVSTSNAAAVTPTTLPEVRTIGTATASTSSNEVTVTWTNGNNGGKNLSAITITPFLNGTTAGTSRTAATTSSTTYTFTNGQLDLASAYTFKVTATNANGTSAFSTASNSITTGNFNLQSLDYLIIAGGGGGGTDASPYYAKGGGGAGGYLTGTATVNFNSLSVTVGAGGAIATNGSNSTLYTLTAAVGGGAGGQTTTTGAKGNDGGSGGGALSSFGSFPGGAGTSGQGNNGGGADSAGNTGGGGGGGATGLGQPGAGGGGQTTPTPAGSANGGYGGAGTASSITGTSVTRAGGGGGGCGYVNTNAGNTPGAGGAGGGGAGSNVNATATAGTANTGGGGGASGGGTNQANNSAAGGSGVVIIKYANTYTISGGSGLTFSTSTAVSGFKVTTFTAGTGTVVIS